jgi:uncharacterized damage-inducible protein DinB
MIMQNVILGLAKNNAWANHRLAGAIAQLDDAAYRDATRTSFFPSIALTAVHILYVDLYYLDAIEEAGRGRKIFDDEDAFVHKPFAEVRAWQRTSDEHLMEVAARVSPDLVIRIERRDHIAVERADAVLLHMLQHSIHHRGQIHAMLSGTSVAPPQLDEFFLAEDNPEKKIFE